MYQKRRSRLACGSLIVSLILGSACGGNGDSDADVENVRIEDSTIRVGEGTVLSVDIAFALDGIFGSDDEVFVVLKLPPELEYRADTAEIQGPLGDESVDPEVLACSDGSTFLSFELDEDDLSGATSATSSADAELSLTINAVSAADVVTVSAAADVDRITASCNGGVPFQEFEQVSIAP